jgi:hypothetical protein
LAVYTFIATPVQLWHHHAYIPEESSGTVSSDTIHDTVAPGTDASFESNCQICSHQYAAYSDDALVPFVAAFTLKASKYGCCLQQLVSAADFPLPNKGPPVLS